MIEKLQVPDEYIDFKGSQTVEKINELIDVVNHIHECDHERFLNKLEKINEKVKERTSALPFEEAMKFLRNGKKITRPGWVKSDAFNKASMNDINTYHLLKNDWMVVDP